MANALVHRGPDDAGVVVWLDHGVGLAHRCLSIIDLSPAGPNPTSNEDGPSGTQVWLVDGAPRPAIHNHLVKIPIHLDDFPLYKRGVSYGEWESQALAAIDESDFVVFGLHDCYADLWRSHYPVFLKKIERLGDFKTFDQVANETVFAHALKKGSSRSHASLVSNRGDGKQGIRFNGIKGFRWPIF